MNSRQRDIGQCPVVRLVPEREQGQALLDVSQSSIQIIPFIQWIGKPDFYQGRGPEMLPACLEDQLRSGLVGVIRFMQKSLNGNQPRQDARCRHGVNDGTGGHARSNHLVQDRAGVGIIAGHKVFITEGDTRVQLQSEVAGRRIFARLKTELDSSPDVAAHSGDPASYVGQVRQHRTSIRGRTLGRDALFGLF